MGQISLFESTHSLNEDPLYIKLTSITTTKELKLKIKGVSITMKIASVKGKFGEKNGFVYETEDEHEFLKMSIPFTQNDVYQEPMFGNNSY